MNAFLRHLLARASAAVTAAVSGALLCATAACGGAADPGSGVSDAESGGDSESAVVTPTSDAGDAAREATCPAANLTTTANPRGGDAPVFTRGLYDYAPTIVHDGVYRMWWCGIVPDAHPKVGDHILYAEASSLDGPWHGHASTVPNSFDVALSPTGDTSDPDNDSKHTCDPSVIRVGKTWYMYFGTLGFADDTGCDINSADPTKRELHHLTNIGVATSVDGLSWEVLNGHQSIIRPANRSCQLDVKARGYGAGQPSVTFVDGLYYLLYTDSTAPASNPKNGAGQYVLRSKDPTFSSGVEELTTAGFAPRTLANHGQHSLIEAFSSDWQYADALDAFVLAHSVGSGAMSATELTMFDRSLSRRLTSKVSAKGLWRDGPGIVSRPDKHAIPSTTCGSVPFDVLHGSGPGGPVTWDLTHAGIDLMTGETCACSSLPRVFEGSLLTSPDRPLTSIQRGRRLQFALAAPAKDIARSSYAVSNAIFDAIPYGAAMHANQKVLGAAGRPASFLLDDGKLWPTSCLKVIEDNRSSITTVMPAAYDAYPLGAPLECL